MVVIFRFDYDSQVFEWSIVAINTYYLITWFPKVAGSLLIRILLFFLFN